MINIANLFTMNLGNLLSRPLRQLAQIWGGAIALAGAGLLATAAPSHSAESIIITYGFLERTVAIEDLEAFAEGRGLSRQLSEYAKNLGLTEQELSTIQTVLNQKADFDEVDVAQFLYTAQGRTLLRFVGDIVQTPTRQSGFYAIRAGLILAAADDAEGLTVLNFLKKYPTPALRIDVGRGLNVAAEVADILGDTTQAIALVRDLAAQEPLLPTVDVSQLQQQVYNLPQFSVITQPIELPFRGVSATLFLPQPRSAAEFLPNEIPLIVISHGLGDERSSYEYLANYLASRGFAVATLDHPGSDSAQIARLLSGRSPDVVSNQEFINRPEDISALLDEIQRFAINSREYRFRLNTQNVGVIGQSFGGYTALALAGATFNLDTLATACEPQPIYLNPSLLLQCQALEAATNAPQLEDDRVKAILVVNPIGSSIFGPSGFAQIDIPVFVMAATADTVAPALPEQIVPFTWLENEYRYLAVVPGTTHFSVINWSPSSAPSIPVPAALLGDDPELSRFYLQVLSYAFFQRHLRQNLAFADALTPGFVSGSLSRSPLEPLSLIQNLPSVDLEQALTNPDLVGDRDISTAN